MAADSKIEWTDHTFNPWIGCTKVSPACDHCYAERSTPSRTLGVAWGPGAPRRRTGESNWELPLRWNKQAEAFHAQHGRRQRVFCASLADVFDNAVDRAWRDDLATLILGTPNLDWLLLTKRIGNAGAMLGDMFLDGPPDNIWLGATICNQAEADRDIAKLLRVPARVRFLSMEPLLGPVDLTDIPISGHGHHEFEPIITGNVLVHKSTLDLGDARPAIDWVIVGGESGPNARPMHPEWAADLRDQCQDAGVPFLFKQWGEWMPEAAMNNDMRMRDVGQYECFFTKVDGSTHWIDKDDHAQFDASDVRMVKVGKKASGRLLDGRTWDEGPT